MSKPLKYGLATFLYLLMSAAFARNDVLVIVNDNSTDSVAIGEYYAQARSIDAQNVVHVRVPNQVFINWTEFQSLRDQILRFGICPNTGEPETRPAACTDPGQPIYTAANMELLTTQSAIKYIVLTRGVPARMTVDGSTLQNPTEPTSIDNYLRYWLARHFTQDVRLDFPERVEASHAGNTSTWRKHFGSIYPPSELEYIVGRIDGVTVASAQALIDRTLQAERNGLYGKFYSQTAQQYPWHFAHGLFDETRPECADETTAGHYMNFAQSTAQGKIPQHCRVAVLGTSDEAPGMPSGRRPLVDDAVMYLGYLDGQTIQGGFNTLLNWRKDATCTSTLCSEASDPAACRAASTDPFREIDTRCVGVASGFLGYNYVSYSAAHFGTWPTGWEARIVYLENDVPRIDAVGADASGSLWFDRPDEVAGANCYSYSGGILGTSTAPCRAKMYLGVRQNLALTGLTPAAPAPLRLKFAARGDSLTALVQLQAQLTLYYNKPANVTCPAGTLTQGSQCLQQVTHYVNVTNSTQWQPSEVTVNPVTFPGSPKFDQVTLIFQANGYVGRIGLDTISVVPTGGTELVRNGSFDGGYLQASDGDFASNFLDRLGGVAYWGSVSHHESLGKSFENISLRSLHFLARGMTLGEAVWLGETHNSGVLYGDPLYSPTAMRMLPLRYSDDEGRFVVAEPLRVSARNGTNPSTREVHFSVCRGQELFKSTTGHPAALRCDRNGGWQDLPTSTTTLTGTNTIASVPFDPTASLFQEFGDYTLRMRVTGTNPATGLTQTFNDYYPVQHRYSDAEFSTLWIEGTVTESGRPMNGVNVQISSGGLPRSMTTDARGRYAISNLPPGTYQATANYSGCTFTPVSLTLTTVGGTAALICTSSGSVITGRVTLNGLGIGGVQVTIQGPSNWTVRTAADGSYRSPTVVAGSYTVSPTLDGLVIQPQTVTVTAGQSAVQDFTATVQAGQIEGIVRETDTLLPVAGIEIEGVRVGTSETFIAYTDANGRFVQGGLVAGTYELSTLAMDYVSSTPTTAMVGSSVNMEVAPWSERKLSGFVVESGTVRTGQTVTLRRLPNGPLRTMTTSIAGFYVFDQLVDGTYEVQAQTQSQVFPARQVQIDRNSALNINFGL